MSKKKEATKSTKVYKVITHLLDDGNDVSNWSHYKILAIDVQHALEVVEGRLQDGEYIAEAHIITILDD